jgi:hypothetical protein
MTKASIKNARLEKAQRRYLSFHEAGHSLVFTLSGIHLEYAEVNADSAGAQIGHTSDAVPDGINLTDTLGGIMAGYAACVKVGMREDYARCTALHDVQKMQVIADEHGFAAADFLIVGVNRANELFDCPGAWEAVKQIAERLTVKGRIEGEEIRQIVSNTSLG